MNDFAALQPYLTVPAQTFQVDEPSFDEEGFASLVLDEQVCVHFQVRQATRDLTLFVLLGEIPARFQTEMLHYALCANLKQTTTRGAVLGLEADTGTLVLHHVLPIEHLDNETLTEHLRGMQRVTQTWHTILHSDAGNDNAATPSAISVLQAALPMQGDLFCPMLFA